MGPWDPNWRPDPTGRRLVAIRAARRGALAAGVIFGSLEVVATVVSVPVDSAQPANSPMVGLMYALFSLPALALRVEEHPEQHPPRRRSGPGRSP